MAGYRRTRGTGPANGELQRRIRFEHRRDEMIRKLADAKTPSERVGVAAGYLRSALKVVSPELSESTASEITEDLITRTDALFKANLRRTK